MEKAFFLSGHSQKWHKRGHLRHIFAVFCAPPIQEPKATWAGGDTNSFSSWANCIS